MISRITEDMRFRMVTKNLTNLQDDSGKLMEKLSTQKMINRPSDDPVGTNSILNFRSAKSSVAQYQNNITSANAWLSLTDTNLSGIKDVLSQAMNVATSESGATASAETMNSSASVVSGLIDHLLSLLNAKTGDNYLFGGSRADIPPFATTSATAGMSAAFGATANTFDGTASSWGVYAGTVNKTYVVKTITGGTLAASTYEISNDGGKTWGTVQNFPPQAVKGNIANTAGGLPITAATVWNTIDGANVQNGTTVAISGTDHNGNAVGGLPADTFTIADATTGTVQDLLSQIESTFNNTVTATIDNAGRITVTDNQTGNSQLTMTLTTTNPAGGSLDFGPVAVSTTTSIPVGDGINMTFTAGAHNLTTNDLFTVHGYAAGYYRGNEDDLTVQVAKDTNFAYNINGAAAFTAANGPVAAASVVGAGAGLTANDTILLTRGATAGSWTLTNNANYPNMVITSQSANTITIDANGDAINDVTLSLSGKWSANNTASFTITPGLPPTLSPVTVHGPGTVDLLTTLNALKAALVANDTDLVAAQIKDLQVAKSQVLTYQTQAGAKMDSLKVTQDNNTAFNEEITNLSSKIEDADTATLITAYQMKQTTLEAAYSMAAQIGQMTILNFLK
jgi:flagellar hook-associated protein 3 FlgL